MPMEYLENIIEFVFLLLDRTFNQRHETNEDGEWAPLCICTQMLGFCAHYTFWPKRKTYQPMPKVIKKQISTTTLETIDFDSMERKKKSKYLILCST